MGDDVMAYPALNHDLGTDTSKSRVIKIPIERRVRHVVAQIVGSIRPSLFYYTANKITRSGIRVHYSGIMIDIVNISAKKIIRINKSNSVYLPMIVESFPYFFGSATPVRIRMHGALYDLIDFSTPRLHQVDGFGDFPVLCPSLTEPFVTTEQYLDFAQ